jgi:adenosylmethionine-8-amino-7-oxononanoate aminotransferase
MIAAMQVAARPGKPAPEDGRLGLALREAALERGVLLRPLHDMIYWMPPLCIEDDELQVLAEATIATIEAVLG